MKIRIAVVQQRIKLLDASANITAARRFLEKAAGKADIIVFPEQFLTGPVGNRFHAVKTEADYLPILKSIARENSVDIAFGLIVRKGKHDAANRAYYIDRRGKVLCRYDKSNLWISERTQIKKGKSVKVFRTRFGKVALLICWDLMDQSLFAQATAQGARIILCPALWWKGSGTPGFAHDRNFAEKFVDAMCLARAYENNIAIAFSNAAGNIDFGNSSDESAGHSQVTMPFTGAAVKIAHNKEGMKIAVIDTMILDKARKYFNIGKGKGKGKTPNG